MKNSCPQLDSNPLPHAYKTGDLTKPEPWHSWLESQSGKREVVESSPTLDKIFLFCILSFFACLTPLLSQ